MDSGPLDADSGLARLKVDSRRAYNINNLWKVTAIKQKYKK